jgi:hypothetical protein
MRGTLSTANRELLKVKGGAAAGRTDSPNQLAPTENGI